MLGVDHHHTRWHRNLELITCSLMLGCMLRVASPTHKASLEAVPVADWLSPKMCYTHSSFRISWPSFPARHQPEIISYYYMVLNCFYLYQLIFVKVAYWYRTSHVTWLVDCAASSRHNQSLLNLLVKPLPASNTTITSNDRIALRKQLSCASVSKTGFYCLFSAQFEQKIFNFKYRLF